MASVRLRQGFTIVELLIVVVVIAILATITIVAYNGITNQAHDTAIQNDLRAAQKLIETSSIETDTYPLPLTASIGIKPSKGAYMTNRNNFYYCRSTDQKSFALSAISRSGNSFGVTNDGQMQKDVNGGDNTCALIGGGSWTSGMSSPDTWAAWTN